MNRQEQRVFWSGVVVLVLIFHIAIWPLLALLAWYVKHIPERRLPMTTLLSGNHKRFYDWLSGFLWDWLKLSIIWAILLAGIVYGFIGLAIYLESTTKMFSLPDWILHQ